MTCVRIDVAHGLASAANNTFPIQADSPDLLHLEGGTCLHAISFRERQDLLEAASLSAEPSAYLREHLSGAATLHLGSDDPHLIEVLALALAGADQDQPLPALSPKSLAQEQQLTLAELISLPAYRVDQLAFNLTPPVEDPWHQIVFPYANLTTLESLAHYLAEQLLDCAASILSQPLPASETEAPQLDSNPPAVPSATSPQQSSEPFTSAAKIAHQEPLTVQSIANSPQTPGTKGVLAGHARRFAGIRASAFGDSVAAPTQPKDNQTIQPTISAAHGSSHVSAAAGEASPLATRPMIQEPRFQESSLALALDHLPIPHRPAIALPAPAEFEDGPVLENHDVSLSRSPSSAGLSWSRDAFLKQPETAKTKAIHMVPPMQVPQGSPVSGTGNPLPKMSSAKASSMETVASPLHPKQEMDPDLLAEQLADLLELEADLRGYLP